MARVVLNTFGSFGDIHPYLAVAIELNRRGHDAVLATAEVYRRKIEAEGIAFAPVRPDLGDKFGDTKFIERLWHPRRGTEYLIREYIMPSIEQSYDDLLPACANADLLLTHGAAYAGPLVAEKLKLPWLSVALQPLLFLSAYDKPVLAPALWLRHLQFLGPDLMKVVFALARKQSSAWAEPVRQLRKKAGLPPTRRNPFFEGQFSSFGTLALFSKHYAAPQPDWPRNVQVTGFPFYDRFGEGLPHQPRTDEAAQLSRFLDSGPPPVLFTLGSSSVMHPGTFYRESFEAARRLGMRAVLLVGATSKEQFPEPIPASIHIASYAPYSDIMPRCEVLVHQGGIGTTAQALRAGRPMIVVPWSHDQPDNAHRVSRLGVGRTVPRGQYTARRIERELQIILHTNTYARAAKELKEKIAPESGVVTACDVIENVIGAAC